MNHRNLSGIPELDEYHSAIQQIRELQEHADALHAKAIERARGMVKAIMDTAGLTPDDLQKFDKPARKPATALYRDPDTGKLWSGQGREPLWIRGKNRDDFRFNAN